MVLVSRWISILAVMLLVLPAPSAWAADYYVRTEASRWITGTGDPLRGIRMSDRLICKSGERCFDLRYIEGDYPYRLSSAQQRAYEEALRQLDFQPGEPAALPSAVGEPLYRAARRHWDRMLGDN